MISNHFIDYSNFEDVRFSRSHKCTMMQTHEKCESFRCAKRVKWMCVFPTMLQCAQVKNGSALKPRKNSLPFQASHFRSTPILLKFWNFFFKTYLDCQSRLNYNLSSFFLFPYRRDGRGRYFLYPALASLYRTKIQYSEANNDTLSAG